jgi:hypothetical protein
MTRLLLFILGSSCGLLSLITYSVLRVNPPQFVHNRIVRRLVGGSAIACAGLTLTAARYGDWIGTGISYAVIAIIYMYESTPNERKER